MSKLSEKAVEKFFFFFTFQFFYLSANFFITAKEFVSYSNIIVSTNGTLYSSDNQDVQMNEGIFALNLH